MGGHLTRQQMMGGHICRKDRKTNEETKQIIKPDFKYLGSLTTSSNDLSKIGDDEQILRYMEKYKYERGKIPNFNFNDPFCKVMIDIMRLADSNLDIKRLPSGEIFVTIHRKVIESCKTHRRSGLHYDGKYYDKHVKRKTIQNDNTHRSNITGLDGGVILVSDVQASRFVTKNVVGVAKEGGDCEHLRDQLICDDYVEIEPYDVFWLSPTTLHESLPVIERTTRTLIRINLPTSEPYSPSMIY